MASVSSIRKEGSSSDFSRQVFHACGRFAAVVTNPAINPTIEVRSYMGVVVVRVGEYLSVPRVNVPENICSFGKFRVTFNHH
jgi:hypothetical protein